MRFLLLSLFLLLNVPVVLTGAVGEEASNAYVKGRSLDALAQYQSALKDAIAKADTKQEVLYLNNIATLYFSLSKIDSAKAYLQHASHAARFSSPLTAIVATNLALLENRSVDWPDFKLKRWEDSLTHFEVSALYLAAARFDIRANRYDDAAKKIERVQKLLENEKKSHLYAESFLRMGELLASKGAWGESDTKTGEALRIYQENGMTRGIKSALTQLILSADKQGRSDRAVLYKEQLNRLPSELR